MGIDFFTLSKARRLVEKKVIEAGGMTPSSVEAIVKANVGTEVNAYLTDNPETEFLNVKKTGAKGDGETDDSKCFLEDAPGYVVNDGIYCVDGATMARLNEKNCIGNGYLQLSNPQLWGNDGSEKFYDVFDYTIAVEDLGDFLKRQMVLAGEADYYASLNRKNATAMYRPLEGEFYARTIGAVYKVQDADLPDNFTVCIGNVQLYVIMKDKVLRRLRVDKNLKGTQFGFFELPWVPEVSRTVASDKYAIFDNYTEFYLTPEDFAGQADGKTESVLHFWGKSTDVGDRDDVIGVICSFDFWIKEEEARDKLIVQIGVDQIDYNTTTIKQACSGQALKMETYPRTHWCTSMNRELLDMYCDSNQLAYLHSLPVDNVINAYESLSPTKEYEKTFITMQNGDIYHKLFDDVNTYRGFQSINPIKHMYLPYYNTNAGATGAYCKLFSIPIVADSTNRYIFKIDYTRVTSSKVVSSLSSVLTIIKSGSAEFNNVSTSNLTYTGAISVVITDTAIDVYAKGVAWGYIAVDIELLMYSHTNNIADIAYDTDLLRVGAGAQAVMCDKWVSVDTTDCTVIESGKTSALEDRIAELETQIASLTASTTTTTIE